MANRIGFVQRALHALVVGRQRSADRYVASYLRDHRITPRTDKH